MPDESPAKRKIETEETLQNNKLKRTRSIGHEDLRSSIAEEVKQIFENRISRLETRVSVLEKILEFGGGSEDAKEDVEIESAETDIKVDSQPPPPSEDKSGVKDEEVKQKTQPPALPPRAKAAFGGTAFQFKPLTNGATSKQPDDNRVVEHKETARSVPVSSKPVFGATTSFGNMGKSKSNSNNTAASATTFGSKSTHSVDKKPSDSTTQTDKPNQSPVTFGSTFGSKSRFGNAFQDSIKQKSFLDDDDDNDDTDDDDDNEDGGNKDNASRENSSGSKDKEAFHGGKEELQTSTTTHQFQQVDLNPVEQTTGEENESSLFTSNAKLFELDLSKISEGWKERGVGPLHLNQSKDEAKSVRLVMRSQGLLRVILNYKIAKETEILRGLEASLAPGKYLRLNSVNAEGRPVQFLIKFANEKLRDELIDQIDKLKSGM
ncbi:uncharacterized protein LODBEIA_P24790 [Lodderomyces beijingensis]|uniref:RanBD1 domain-containing protein n=1 Tax=Lodderomyces beijingensis TaxID=1775926 RepID=A0ABP0ZM27_9ASCO